MGVGISSVEPGSAKGLHVVVADIAAAHAELVGRGVAVSEPFHFGPQGGGRLDDVGFLHGTRLDPCA